MLTHLHMKIMVGNVSKLHADAFSLPAYTFSD